MQFDQDALARACEAAIPHADHQALRQSINHNLPGVDVQWALTRGQWYRIGGVVDGADKPVADQLRTWAEAESDGDIMTLIEKFGDRDLFVTKHLGRTHYLVAPCSDRSLDFIQIEVEEIYEVVDRPLFSDDWIPDDIEDLLDPEDGPVMDPKPISRPRYNFRQATYVADALQNIAEDAIDRRFARFREEWEQSSAGDATRLCDYWILIFSRYHGPYGEHRIDVTPTTTFTADLPDIDQGLKEQGTGLANFIHAFDRAVGFPMAWYFFMLTSKKHFHDLAHHVHKDLMGAYAYLPAKDLKILKNWIVDPYCF